MSLCLRPGWVRIFILSLLVLLASGCTRGTGGFAGNPFQPQLRGTGPRHLPPPDDSLSKTTLPDMTARDHEAMGDTLLQRGNPPGAYIQYGKALLLSPGEVRLLTKQAGTLLAAKRSAEAVRDFTRIVEAHPDYAPAQEGLGVAFFQMTDYDRAAPCFQKAVELDPKRWKSFNYLGNIHDFRKEFDQAAAAYQAALALQPRAGLVYNNLGVSRMMAGQFPEAIAAFEQALALGYREGKIYNNLGLTLARMGRHTQALEVFRKAGSEARAYNNLGCVYLSEGRTADAARSFEKAIEIEPSFYVRAGENLEKTKP